MRFCADKEEDALTARQADVEDREADALLLPRDAAEVDDRMEETDADCLTDVRGVSPGWRKLDSKAWVADFVGFKPVPG